MFHVAEAFTLEELELLDGELLPARETPQVQQVVFGPTQQIGPTTVVVVGF